MQADGGLERGDELLLRYLYNDGALQASLPLRVVIDTVEVTVAWLAPGSPIMYWATEDGADPRDTPLERRFLQHLTTAARTWQGAGVLRVMPAEAPYQVIHFWRSDGSFAGWYVNFEAPRIRSGACIDTVDWHLDLWIAPDRTTRWKDEDEAEAALGTQYLKLEDYQAAREAGQAILASIDTWPSPIGDWRSFRPEPAWSTPDLHDET